jgi:hypothetical protein
MFRGSALITPKNATMLPFRVKGDWLYKPDAKCWYCNGHSFPEGIVGDIQEAE